MNKVNCWSTLNNTLKSIESASLRRGSHKLSVAKLGGLSVTNVAQVLIGLLTTFIGFLLGVTWKASRRWLAYWRSRRFWRPFLSADLRIVVGRFKEFNEFEASGLVGVGDMQAAAELISVFEEMRFRRSGRSLDIIYHDDLPGDIYGANLICIGGPEGNKVARRILERTECSLVIEESGLTIASLDDSAEGSTYSPRFELNHDGRKNITLDYGLIVKGPNPFEPLHNVIVIAGIYGYGTWAGAKLLRMSQFLQAELVSTGCALECLYKVEVIEEVAQRPEIVQIRRIFA